MNIYLITNKINGKQYIGQTRGDINARWIGHIRESRRSCLPLYSAIKKYGKNSFFVARLDTAISQDELNQKEKDYIWAYQTCNKSLGYNIHEGGNKPPKQTVVSARKTAEKTRGRKREGVALENIREAVKKRKTVNQFTTGHVVPLEWRLKIGAAHKGMKHTPESIEKIRKGATSKEINKMTDEILNLYKTGLSACKIGKILNINHGTVRMRVKQHMHLRTLSEATTNMWKFRKGVK